MNYQHIKNKLLIAAHDEKNSFQRMTHLDFTSQSWKLISRDFLKMCQSIDDD